MPNNRRSPEQKQQRIAALLEPAIPSEEKLQKLREALVAFESYRIMKNKRLPAAQHVRASQKEYEKWIHMQRRKGADTKGLSIGAQISNFSTWNDARLAARLDVEIPASGKLRDKMDRENGNAPEPYVSIPSARKRLKKPQME